MGKSSHVETGGGDLGAASKWAKGDRPRTLDVKRVRRCSPEWHPLGTIRQKHLKN